MDQLHAHSRKLQDLTSARQSKCFRSTSLTTLHPPGRVFEARRWINLEALVVKTAMVMVALIGRYVHKMEGRSEDAI